MITLGHNKVNNNSQYNKRKGMKNSTNILLVRHLGRITSWLKGYVDSFFSRMSAIMDEASTVSAGLTKLNETVAAAEKARDDAEFQRRGKEKLREAHESTRVANEDQRVLNESARIEAESLRQANETHRQEVIDNLEDTLADKIGTDTFDSTVSTAMELLDDKVDKTTFNEAMDYGLNSIEELSEAVLETPFGVTVELGAPQSDGTAKARIISIDMARLDLIVTSADQNKTVITNALVKIKRHGDSEASAESETFRMRMSAVDNSALPGQEGDMLIPLIDSSRLGVIAENIRCSFQKVQAELTLTSAPEVTAKLVSTTRNDYTDEDKAKLTGLLPNGQFGYKGLYSMDGKFYADPSYANSGLISVNRKFDLEFAANVGGSVASVVFFDGAKRFISAVQIPQTLAPQVLPAADIPADAVFFVISTATPARSYYRNGSTIEAREGAMSEALATLGSDLAELPVGDRFTIKGYFLGKYGNVNITSSENSGITPLLPLSRTYPIVLQNVRAYNNAVAVCFYDAAGNFISYPEGIENLTGDFTVTPDKYPANACYFRACTEKAGSSYTHGPSVESHEGAISEAIQASKLALFIDEFSAAAGINGKYDPVNAPDSRHPFYLNTLWLTYEEAVASMAHINEIYLRGGCSMKGLKIRTNMLSAIPLSTGWGTGLVDLNGVCLYNSIEVLNVGDIVVDKSSVMSAFAYHCDNLHTIIGQISLSIVTRISTDAFRLSPKLQNVRLFNLKVSVSFKDCPLLSLDSMQYMVDNAANTEAITVTVHPDIYNKLANEQADIMALLPENLLTGEVDDLSGVTRIDNGVMVNAPKSYFRMGTAHRLVSEGNGKLTLSCDVEGLHEGESITYYIGGGTGVRPQWIISANGRATFSFDAKTFYMNDPAGRVLMYDAIGSYTGQGLRLTNFKLSYGEHEELPYTAPLSSITDAEVREQAEWASLMQIAEARQINFVTTE